MDKYKFTLIGGDKRIFVLAQLLRARGHTVNLCKCCDEANSLSGVTFYSNYKTAIADADVLILPMPISRDKLHVATGTSDGESILLEDIFKCASKYGIKHVLGGNISKEILDIADRSGVSLVDYSLSEQFLISNAEATAEGGLMIAMENTDKTIKGSDVLVGGFGRIAKHLSGLLYALGADVTIAARSEEALDNARTLGYKTVRLCDDDKNTQLKDALQKCDLVFNTVPALIFRREHFGDKNTSTYIELASCPGGIDLRSAREAGMKIIFAPSLPGRCFSVSAGKYIYDSIYESLKIRRIYI